MPTHARPLLAIDCEDEPVEDFVRELQVALDTSDADLFNRHFATDVLWGSPFGAVVDGYDDLHLIHTRMFSTNTSTNERSRYSIEHTRRLRDDVVAAFVRRTSDAPSGSMEPGRPDTFDELALFVLVRADDRWWLAAGQHVPDRRHVYG